MRSSSARERIQQGILTLIPQQSFSDIIIDDIIRLAGVNRSTFYYHYQDKYDLRGQLIDRMITELLASIPLRPGEFHTPPLPDIDKLVGAFHQKRDLFLQMTHPNWEIDTLALANRYFVDQIVRWAEAQPVQGYSPQLFAQLYASSALATIQWAFAHNADSRSVARLISDHLDRGFFRSFLETRWPS